MLQACLKVSDTISIKQRISIMGIAIIVETVRETLAFLGTPWNLYAVCSLFSLLGEVFNAKNSQSKVVYS